MRKHPSVLASAAIACICLRCHCRKKITTKGQTWKQHRRDSWIITCAGSLVAAKISNRKEYPPSGSLVILASCLKHRIGLGNYSLVESNQLKSPSQNAILDPSIFCMKSSHKSTNPSDFCRHKIHQTSSKNYRVIQIKSTNPPVGSINKIQPQIMCLIT